MDKLNIPVYIISINGETAFDFHKYFNNVTIVPAIDTRKRDPLELFQKNIITFRSYNDLINGRKDHFAFPGLGGIGLYLTYRKLISDLKGTKENVLICEQDCLIKNLNEFSRKIESLKSDFNFDCAIFGGHIHKPTKKLINQKPAKNESNSEILSDNSEVVPNNAGGSLSNETISDLSNDFINYKGVFFCTHSVVWSPKGIKVILNFINNPIEVQLDAAFSYLCTHSFLNLLMEKKATTRQSIHESFLNNDVECKLCNTDANSNIYNQPHYRIVLYNIKCFSIILIVLITLFIVYFKLKCKC